MRTFVVLAVLAVGEAVWGQSPPTVPQDGFWGAKYLQWDGKVQLPDPKAREPLTLVIANGEYRMYHVQDPKTGKAFRLFTADFKPDPAHGTFEMEVKDGQKKGQKIHGIYSVADGEFRICYGPADQPRPAKFETTPGSGHFYEVWTYMNPQPKAAK